MNHNLEATVFVYKSKVDGSIRAEYMEGSMSLDKDEWVHLATLEPRMWIQAHYEDIEKADERARKAYARALEMAVNVQAEAIALKVEEMGMQGFGTLAIAAAIRRGIE